jgi:hypothetical protein
MDPRFLEPLISDLHGSAGGLRARTVFGKTVFVPVRKHKLAVTPGASFVRQCYVAIEALWNMQAKYVKEAWLRRCHVKYLSGRDLWGRCNWHPVVEHDRYILLPPDSQPEKALKWLPPGTLPVPPEVTRILGGALAAHPFPLTAVSRQERQGVGISPNLPAAIAAAYADVSSKPWVASSWPLLGAHLIDLQATVPYIVRVLQLRSLLRRGVDARCTITVGDALGTFGPSAVGHQVGGPVLAGLYVPAADPLSVVKAPAGSPLLAAGQWLLDDHYSWGDMGCVPVWGSWSGWNLIALVMNATGRG